MKRSGNCFNPYTLLTPELLLAMLRQPMLFVRQHYPRGRSDVADTTVPILLTHYIHHEVDSERAHRHMRLLYHDPLRRLYDSTLPDDRKKLETAATQPQGYHIYVNLLSAPWHANEHWKKKIAAFVRLHLPQWKPAASCSLKVSLKDRFGSLYIGLAWKHHQTEVLLDEIENIQACAMT